MRFRFLAKTGLLAIALSLVSIGTRAADVYGGVGTTGVELGVAAPLGSALGARVEVNALSYRTDFSTSGIHYDAKLKATNAGVYLDAFLIGEFRVSGGALVGSRKYHGTANGIGGTIVVNGVTYPVSPGDMLDFDAKFPSVTPYLGIGWAHRGGRGLHFYADAGVAYGRPKVTLSPTASLATKIDPSDLTAEQSSVQDKADRYRAYPVLKLGIAYAF